MMKRNVQSAVFIVWTAGALIAQSPTTILDTQFLNASLPTINDNFSGLYNQIVSVNSTKASLVDCTGTPGQAVRKLNGALPSECGTIDGGSPVLSNLTVKTLNNIRFASQFTGADCGAKINAAYADLPAAGGQIIQDISCSFSTPISFSTSGKAALLTGFPGGAVTMTFLAVTGTAVTLNYGTGAQEGRGLRDLTLTGPGPGTGAIGVLMGGSNGAQGTTIDNSKIQSFGVNLQLGSNTTLAEIRQTMIRDSTRLVLFPSSLTQSGENIRFDHVAFADAPAPHTDAVWIQGGGQEIVFESCSFDQAQLHVGNALVSAAQVVVHGSHFSNPNYATGSDYDFVTVDNNASNFIRLTDSFIAQQRPSGSAYARLMLLNGGTGFIGGLGVSSTVQVTNFGVLGNAANVSLYGYNDLSGNTVTLFGGSTSGYTTSFPGSTGQINSMKVTGLTGIDKRPVCLHADGTMYGGNTAFGTLSCP